MCSKIEVLIEPVFENEKLTKEIEKLQRDLIGLQRITTNLITVSSIISEFRLSVQAKCERKVGKKIDLEIRNIRIKDENGRFERTFENIEISVECKDEFGDYKEGALTDSFRMIFPSPGLYWLELEVWEKSGKSEICKIETKHYIETIQRMTNGKIGRGWSKYEMDEHGNIKHNFLRQPIAVVDSFEIYQAKLNRSIKHLTVVMLLLMLLISIVDYIPSQDWITKVVLVFGAVVFMMVFYLDP